MSLSQFFNADPTNSRSGHHSDAKLAKRISDDILHPSKGNEKSIDALSSVFPPNMV
jgi:hypothetical protein